MTEAVSMVDEAVTKIVAGAVSTMAEVAAKAASTAAKVMAEAASTMEKDEVVSMAIEGVVKFASETG